MWFDVFGVRGLGRLPACAAGILLFLLSPLHLSGCWRQQSWYSDQVVGDHLECEESLGFGEASELELGSTTVGLDPAEALLDALAAALSDLIPLVRVVRPSTAVLRIVPVE